MHFVTSQCDQEVWDLVCEIPFWMKLMPTDRATCAGTMQDMCAIIATIAGAMHLVSSQASADGIVSGWLRLGTLACRLHVPVLSSTTMTRSLSGKLRAVLVKSHANN